MSFTGFTSDYIRVTLGSNFNGNGNGLNEDDVMILTRWKNNATQQSFSEDGTSTADVGSNRINVNFGTTGSVPYCNIQLVSTFGGTTGMFATSCCNIEAFLSGSNYNFLDIFSSVNYSTFKILIFDGFAIPSSWLPPATYAYGTYRSVSPLWRGNVFKTLELSGPPPSGWTGTVCGITNPAYVLTVDVTNIASVMGV